MTARVRLVIGSFVVLCPISAAAQGSVSGGAIVSWQNAPVMGQNPSIPEKGIGGHALGFSAGLDWLFTPGIGVRFEFADAGVFDYEQVANKYRTRGTYDDRTISGLVCWCRGRVHWSAGLSAVHEEVSRESALFSFVTNRYEPFFGVPTITSMNTVAMTLGADLPINIARHFSLAPQVRVHLVSRRDTDPTFGLGGLQLRPGIVGRVHF